MHLTIIHPCIGRQAGDRSYIRTWQMEPLPASTLAALTPDKVDITFFDDRMEPIQFDAPTDLVAISIETYTARRSYQIASEYRKRGVPVVMGGFHATLMPDEVAQYADAVVTGEAEQHWKDVIEDASAGRLKKFYRSEGRPTLGKLVPDRSIYRGKRYLPVGLVEFGRGCAFRCDFCAVQTVFNQSKSQRPLDTVVSEIASIKDQHKLFFFVDDNFTTNLEAAKAFMRELIPLKIRWVSQASINAAHDEEFLQLMKASGCRGVLIGFESLNSHNLAAMNKGFNTMAGGYRAAMEKLRRHRIRVYGTFIFGYDQDDQHAFQNSLAFAQDAGMYIAAFNHLTPFPGTPLYHRLEEEKRLVYDAWWLDPAYRYNEVPFYPKGMEREELQRSCISARREFYGWRSIVQRAFKKPNFHDLTMFFAFFFINALHRKDVSGRDGFPLGDLGWRGELIRA